MLMAMAMLLTSICAMAQAGKTVEVRGTLKDSLTSEGEPYATIRITKKGNDSKPLKMGVTDKTGKFILKTSGTGEMTITISSVGRKPVVKDFTVKPADKIIDLGTLLTSDAGNELQQVVIKSQKPLVKADIDKITYNMEDDPDSKSNTVLEMLRKVPLVTVDGEDNIKVNGKSSFKVYVNGKPNKMMSDNPTEVLKSLPANSIKHIEVITNPGPKYDAEGVGGILNIVTVGGGLEGYTATLRADARDQGLGGGGFGTVKSGKLTVSARYNYNHHDNPKNYSETRRTTIGEITGSSSDLATSSETKYKGNSHSGSIEASYEIDTLRLLTMEFGLWGNNSDSHTLTTSRGLMPGTGAELYYGQATVGGNNSRFSINGGIDYQRLFKVKDRMLTLSYRVSTSPSTSDSYSKYYDTRAADQQWQDFVDKLKEQQTDGKQNTAEHTFQADYTTPIGKAHTVEAGVKYILRNNTAENYRRQKDLADGEFEDDMDHSSHYKHRNDILAAYTGYGLKAGKWSGRLGLRYEHTLQDVKYLLGRGTDFSKDFDDIVPSASIGYKLTETSNLRLGYNMRIYRPGIWYLNPYFDDTDPTYIRQGNPELTSEKTHSANISYSNFAQKLNYNIHIGYSTTNNSIESVSELVSDLTLVDKGLQKPTGKDVIYSTYKNIGKSKSLDISLYANWNATSSTRIYANTYIRYAHLEDGMTLRNHGWFMNANGGIQQSLPKEWRISVNGFYQSPWIMLQGKGTPWFDYSINVNKSFLKKRLTISAFASNFFNKYASTDWSEQSANFMSQSTHRMQRMRYGISLNFRIGELKASVKKAERTVSNDDVKSSGGKGE